MANKRDLSAENRKPRQIRISDQEYEEIGRAADLDEITRAALIRAASLDRARAIVERHQARVER